MIMMIKNTNLSILFFIFLILIFFLFFLFFNITWNLILFFCINTFMT